MDTDPGERGSWFSDERRATERLANKSALTAVLSDDTTTKGTPAYYNAEVSKKTAYDNAVAAGKVVLAKDNATQTEVNNALSAITTAKNALGGNATTKTRSKPLQAQVIQKLRQLQLITMPKQVRKTRTIKQ